MTLDARVEKPSAPIDRTLGQLLLGSSTVQSFRSNGNGNGSNTGFIGVVR
jgi:hypothetical protein